MLDLNLKTIVMGGIAENYLNSTYLKSETEWFDMHIDAS